MKYNKDNPLRVFIAFAGYDSQSLALQRLKQDYPEFDFVRVGWAEFDPQSKNTNSEPNYPYSDDKEERYTLEATRALR